MDTTQALDTLEQEFQIKRQAILDVQSAEEKRLAELAHLEATKAANEQKAAAKAEAEAALAIAVEAVRGKFEHVRGCLNAMRHALEQAKELEVEARRRQSEAWRLTESAIEELGAIHETHGAAFATGIPAAAARRVAYELLAGIEWRPPNVDYQEARRIGLIASDFGQIIIRDTVNRGAAKASRLARTNGKK